MTNRSQLKRLAEGATKGPWALYHKGDTLQIDYGDGYGTRPCIVMWAGFDGNDIPRKRNIANATFIAACDPDTILALVDAAEALRISLAWIDTLDTINEVAKPAIDSAHAALARLDAIEKERT